MQGSQKTLTTSVLMLQMISAGCLMSLRCLAKSDRYCFLSGYKLVAWFGKVTVFLATRTNRTYIADILKTS